MFTISDFLNRVGSYSPQAEQAAAVWQDWAGDMDGLPQEALFETVCWKLQQTAALHGPRAAQMALELALYPFCILPWDLPDAGELLAQGMSPDYVFWLAAKGYLAGAREWMG